MKEIWTTHHLLGTVVNAVRAVAVLQVTGRSVGVENAQIFWTIDACGGGGEITKCSRDADALKT